MANSGSATVTVISATTNTVITTITLSGTPRGLGYDFLNSRIFVTDTTTNTVETISTINRKDGFIGINTVNPISEFDVRGKITTEEFRLTTGANNGYFLVSDTLGNATWQYPIIEIIGGTGLTGSGTAGVITIVANLEENSGLTFSSLGEITTDFSTLASSLQGNGLTANAGVLDINVNNGISIIDDIVQISDTAAGNGLTFSSGIFDINTSNGLTIISDSVQISDTSAGSGLTFSLGVFDINTSNGLTILSDSVQVADTISGKGLTFSSGVIDINLGQNSGLTFSGDDVIVDTNIAGNGLDISSGVLTVNTSEITPGLAGNGLTANGSTLDVNVGNGLELVSDQVYLGGTLSQNTTINGDGYNLTIQNINTLTFTASDSINLITPRISTSSEYSITSLSDSFFASGFGYSSPGFTFSLIFADSNGIYNLIKRKGELSSSTGGLYLYNTENTLWNGTTGSMVVKDVVSSKGLVYYDDYSASFTTHSLVTKGYVDSVSTSKYSTIVGFTASLAQTITHGLSTDDIIVQAYDSSGIQVIPGTVQINGINDVDITFSSTLSNIKIIVIG